MIRKYIKSGLYFRKDKKAQVYKYHEGGYDEEGFATVGYYTPIAKAPLWCYSKQLSQVQLYASHTFWNDETRFFVFNYRDDIEQGDTLHYLTKDQWYEVTRVDTTDDYKGELFVYVKNLKRPLDDAEILPDYKEEP